MRAEKNRTPILMLSAKGQEIDKVVGLELGRGRLRDQALQPARTARPRAGAAPPRRRPAPSPPMCRTRLRSARCASIAKRLRGQRGKHAFELTPRELKVLALLLPRTRQRGLARNDPHRSLGHRILRHHAHARSARRQAPAEDRSHARASRGICSRSTGWGIGWRRKCVSIKFREPQGEAKIQNNLNFRRNPCGGGMRLRSLHATIVVSPLRFRQLRGSRWLPRRKSRFRSPASTLFGSVAPLGLHRANPYVDGRSKARRPTAL